MPDTPLLESQMPLTPQKLASLAQFPHLKNSWFLVAATTLSVLNQPQEVPKVFHYALKLSQYNNENVNYLKVAQDSIDRSSKFTKPSNGKTDNVLFTTIENLNNLPIAENQKRQFEVSSKIREALLKSAAIAGVPKAINSLTEVKNATPLPLRYTEVIRDDESIDIRKRGQEYWNTTYGKLSNRIQNNMKAAYPDLWYVALNHLYGPIFSFTGVLKASETSLGLIAALIPQDVNPQLKGHLRGAVNNGCTKEEIQEARELSLMICEWYGITWKEPVAKLKL